MGLGERFFSAQKEALGKVQVSFLYPSIWAAAANMRSVKAKTHKLHLTMINKLVIIHVFTINLICITEQSLQD